MSYCRWSTDNFRCDLYCYESDSGFIINVAGRRNRAVENLPPEFDTPLGDDGGAIGEFLKRHMAVMGLIREMGHEDTAYTIIGLPHDGEEFIERTEPEMFERILYLEGLGYRIPKYLHDEAVAATRKEA